MLLRININALFDTSSLLSEYFAESHASIRSEILADSALTSSNSTSLSQEFLSIFNLSDTFHHLAINNSDKPFLKFLLSSAISSLQYLLRHVMESVSISDKSISIEITIPKSNLLDRQNFLLNTVSIFLSLKIFRLWLAFHSDGKNSHSSDTEACLSQLIDNIEKCLISLTSCRKIASPRSPSPI